VGTYNTGVWRLPLEDPVNVCRQSDAGSGLRDFDLLNKTGSQPNGRIAIGFSVPYDAFVDISVFNTLGKKTAVLAAGRFNRGQYDIGWDAGRSPAGTYICRMRAGTITRTLSILKTGKR
jgi:hypothetical protein